MGIGEKDATGSVRAVYGVFQDITEDRLAADQLRAEKARADESSEAKSRFLANMSHEIRTPLNALLGLSYVLEQSALDPDQRALVNQIQGTSTILGALINDILDLSKIESGELDVDRRPVDVSAIAAEVVKLLGTSAQSKGVVLSAVGDETVPTRLLADESLLRQMLMNLVGNAIKFTPAGGRVDVDVTCSGMSEGTAHVVLSVTDTGIGIDPQTQDRLFEPFVQADGAAARRFEGTGLGLSIVRRLSELMGGRAGVDSALGSGSRFWVELPLEVAALSAEHSDAPTRAVTIEPDTTRAPDPGILPLVGKTIMVVDDNAVNVTVARRVLELKGAQVVTCSGGQEALNALLQPGSPPDLVLLDIQMPEVDGYQVARRLREAGVVDLPIVALTAGALATERAAALESGMNDFMTKPIEPDRLVAVILRYTDGIDAAPAVGRESKSPATDWPEIPGIDADSASRRLGGNVPAFLEVLRSLLSDDPTERLRALAADPAGADRIEVARFAHRLRGGAGNVGAVRLQDAAAACESACLAGTDDDELQRLLESTAEEWESLARSVEIQLRGADTAPDGAPSADEPPGVGVSDAVAEIKRLLSAQDLLAVVRADELAQPLTVAVGSSGYRELRSSIRSLDYARAKQILAGRPAPGVATIGQPVPPSEHGS